MTPDQIAYVRETFAAVKPIASTAAQLFYGRLFELDPSLRPMFRRDLAEQGRMLMQVIGVTVAGLDRLPTLVPTLQALGRRHAAYGVRDAHYEVVGAALMWTLAQALGRAFTPEVRAAWASAYAVLARTMQEGASMTEAAA
jgi:hemoglobin-like flavoprotein